MWEISDGGIKRMADARVMRPPEPERSKPPPFISERTLCALCRDVIGVYEPLVHVLGNLVSRTSLAAEPGVAIAGGERYHAGCYERSERDPQLVRRADPE
jgi:hypothetical protein